ncbi:MAG TPA: hypothetical protein VGG56_15515 [Terracidiphilus sp.]|jgi:hypothetical protein
MKINLKLSLASALLMLVTIPARASVTVSNPANGAEISSPFTLSASAGNCSSQTISAMGYSLDSSTDTTIVDNSSVNAQVPASAGAHTLHVKAWGNKGAACVTDVAITVAGNTSAVSTGGLSVSSPGMGAEVSPSFTLTANAGSCSLQPVVAMGYSFDNSSDTTIVDSASLNTQIVNAPAGAHTLHVKSWGNRGAGCAVAVPLTILGASVPSSNGITVTSPSNGAQVGTSFSLVASADGCSSRTVAAMGYSLDGSTDTTIVDSSSVAATITASAGAHTLHVKAWGNGGGACDTDVAITAVSTTPTAPAPGIVVTSPANGATVSSDFTVDATAAACSSQPVSSMGYSLDSGAETTFNGTTLNASVAASTGAHTLHVESLGNQGAQCAVNVAINVNPVTTTTPSGAISVSDIQAMSSWKADHDIGTPGTSGGTTSIVSSPSLSDSAREFNTTFAANAGERYYVSFGDDQTSTHFLYDVWLYLTPASASIANIEMDMNQVMPNGQTVIFGFQCDGWDGTWDYTANAGTPQNPIDEWIHSKQSCNPRSWSLNTWHHVQIAYSRDDEGNVTYESAALDGVVQNIDATVPSAFALGWSPTLLTNLQIDGQGASGANTIYMDNLTISRW